MTAKKNCKLLIKNRICLIIFSVLSVLILGYMLNFRSKMYGDGGEYYLMLESFANHKSFDLREPDWLEVQQQITDNSDKSDMYIYEGFPYQGYFLAKDNKYYSYHFWFYSFINYPIKFFIHHLKLNETNVFQITNSLLLSFTLIFSTIYIKLPQFKKLIILFLILLNPVIWYISWPHPEIFCYCLVTMSLIMFINRHFKSAIFFSSIASIQNTPIIFLSLFFVIYYFYLKGKPKSLSHFFKIISSFIICLIPSALPLMFYYLKYHSFNLIMSYGYSDIKYISLHKVFELFFDFNIGILPYMPLFFLFVVAICLYYLGDLIRSGSVYHFFKFQDAKDIVSIIGLLLVLIIQLLISSSTKNWNSGMLGPARYTIWTIIPIFIAISIIFISKKNTYIYTIFLISSVFCNAFIIAYYGFLDPNSQKISEIKYSYLSKIVLEVLPSCYNPSTDIFIARTLQKPINPYNKQDFPLGLVIYKDKNNTCRKALIENTKEDFSKLTEECIQKAHINKCKQKINIESWNSDNYCYVSF
jgi:hypothetical protein